MEDDKSISTTSTSKSDDQILDGEIFQLQASLENEASPPLPQSSIRDLKKSSSGVIIDDTGGGVYGNPLSVEEAAFRMPDAPGGLGWNATIVPDKFVKNGHLKGGLKHRDFDMEKEEAKPRRASLPVTATDFFSSLTMVPSETVEGGVRFVFAGILNGWPGLRHLELVSLEQRRGKASAIPSPKELVSGQILWMTIWKADEQGAKGLSPRMQDVDRIHRARLRAAPWSSSGWSSTSPGFVFWYQAQQKQAERRFLYGTQMTNQLDDCQCTTLHMFSHRYARARENPRDKLTYHSICLLEWDHGDYMTVVETAYLNGMGGYQGQSNWYDDADTKNGATGLYQAFPPELLLPWRTDMSEIRCYDVKAKNLDEFRAYVQRFSPGSTEEKPRFVDPQLTNSLPARLTFRSKKHIARYLVNYISRDSSYAELKRNCQTFTADLVSFLAGKKNVPPFHPVSRIEYQNRTHLFLYDSNMYEKKKRK